MVVWGGYHDSYTSLNSGGVYDPIGNNWWSTSTVFASAPRVHHTAVWTGSKMIVWGGNVCFNYICSKELNTGGTYVPITDTWTAISLDRAPQARYRHTAVWTGTQMIVWGGFDGSNYFNSGGIYTPPGTPLYLYYKP